jgi:hypothetical protein
MNNPDCFDPVPDQVRVIVVGAATLRQAEALIVGSESCKPDEAEIPFDWIIDRVTGSDPSVTDYILEMTAKCPRCIRRITEKSLVEPE